MFSGSDSTESQNYTQWPLNASAYQTLQNEQVDWAALAHQWIKMKEAGPPIPEKKINVPPPPVISTMSPTKGEAPMDVENDSDSNNLGLETLDSLNWNQQQSSWNWNNTNWPPTIQSLPLNKAPLLPTPAYNTFNANIKDDLYSGTMQSATGYWSSSTSANARGTTKLLKPHNKRFSKVNVPLKSTTPCHPIAQNSSQSITPPPPMIDANKRKQLPAWIREGLEKMERDKLKQMDRHREKDKLEDAEEEKKKLRENALEILKNTVVKQSDEKPLDNYDSNQSDDPDFDDGNSQSPSGTPIKQLNETLTQEEMMLKVRRTMTEILLKVTNREIAQICKEELQRNVRKKKAIDQHVTAPSAGANLSARLGLGAYIGSGESSDESDEVDEKSDGDSDNELRNIIKKRKENFVKTERDIENRLAEAEKDRHASKSRAETPESEDSPRDKSQDRRSHTPKMSRKTQSSKRHGRDPPSSRSSTRSSSSSLDRRSSRRAYRRSRSSSRSRPSNGRRSDRHRKYSRSRSRSRSHRSYRRRDSRSPVTRSRRSRSRSRRRSRRRTRSRTRSRSRSRNDGRGKRSHRH